MKRYALAFGTVMTTVGIVWIALAGANLLASSWARNIACGSNFDPWGCQYWAARAGADSFWPPLAAVTTLLLGLWFVGQSLLRQPPAEWKVPFLEDLDERGEREHREREEPVDGPHP